MHSFTKGAASVSPTGSVWLCVVPCEVLFHGGDALSCLRVARQGIFPPLALACPPLGALASLAARYLALASPQRVARCAQLEYVMDDIVLLAAGALTDSNRAHGLARSRLWRVGVWAVVSAK